MAIDDKATNLAVPINPFNFDQFFSNVFNIASDMATVSMKREKNRSMKHKNEEKRLRIDAVRVPGRLGEIGIPAGLDFHFCRPLKQF